MSRTARARLKRFEELAPQNQCCEGMRKSLEKSADVEFDVFVGASHPYSRKCGSCAGTETPPPLASPAIAATIEAT